MAPRHLGGRDHDVVADLPAERDALVGHLVFAPIHQRDQPASGGPGGLLRGRRRRLHLLGEAGGRDALCTATLGVVTIAELLATDLDLVAVEERARFGAKLHAVHEHDGVRATPDDHAGPVRRNPDKRPRRRVIPGQAKRGAIERPDRLVGGRERDPFVAELEVRHPGRKLPPAPEGWQAEIPTHRPPISGRYLSLVKDRIRIRGARQHNLSGFDLEIPRRAITVITGPSGSGKSSLAFDTIYAEGQRRYVESLSAYARQFQIGRAHV